MAENMGEEKAEEMIKATKTVNFFREKHNIPPIKIDAEKAQEAQDYLIDYIINLPKSDGGRRRL